MAVPLLLLCIPLSFWLAMNRRVPALLPLVVPVAIGVLFFFAWKREATWTGGGDPQPGLVALVGKGSVGLILLAMLLGYMVRRRSGSSPKQ